MFEISVEKIPGCSFYLSPMSIKRDWMDNTAEGHAYRCFPVTQANVVGWSLSCKQNIEFEWDGINDQTAEHINIISAPEGAYGGRGQSSISFNTNLVFKTNEDVSILTINPVNYFSDDFETMSNLMSTSFYDNPLPLAIKAKAATIIPISLTKLNNTAIEIVDHQDQDRKRETARRSYGEATQPLISSGQWTDWYRNAVNEKNESLGEHEVKVLRLSVIDNTKDKGNGII
jgi:hypothetical protein